MHHVWKLFVPLIIVSPSALRPHQISWKLSSMHIYMRTEKQNCIYRFVPLQSQIFMFTDFSTATRVAWKQFPQIVLNPTTVLLLIICTNQPPRLVMKLVLMLACAATIIWNLDGFEGILFEQNDTWLHVRIVFFQFTKISSGRLSFSFLPVLYVYCYNIIGC